MKNHNHLRTKIGAGALLTAMLLGSMVHVSAGPADFVELPRSLEIELALSALPAELQDDATVYVRDPKAGFVVHRKGRNGFTTFVARTSVRFYEAGWPYAYPRDQLIPMAFDKVGFDHHRKPFFDLEKMRIDGVPAKEAKVVLKRRFRDRTYSAPPTGGLSYMLAPIHRAYVSPDLTPSVMTFSFPHYMPYAPHVRASSLGTMDPHFRAGVLGHGGEDSGPHGYFYFKVPADAERAIREKYARLLADLCALHAEWCLPETPGN